MNGLPYYKAYPRDFIEGTIGMDFELKGAYRLILDLIYMQGGNLPDDARYISGLLGCTIKKWNNIRAKLVELGKIEVRGEFLANYRADKELETLGKLSEKQRQNRANPNKNRELQSPRFDHTEPDTDTDTERGSGVREREALTSFKAELERIVGPDLSTAEGIAEAQRWLALVPAEDALQSISEQVAAAKGKIKTLKYFTPAIQRLAAIMGEELAPTDPPAPKPQKQREPRPDPMMRALAQLQAEGRLPQ